MKQQIKWQPVSKLPDDDVYYALIITKELCDNDTMQYPLMHLGIFSTSDDNFYAQGEIITDKVAFWAQVAMPDEGQALEVRLKEGKA